MSAATNGTQVSEQPRTVTAIVRAPAPAAIEPTNMGELNALAQSAAKTGFFGAKTPEQALVILMAGRDLGLSYSQALRAFHVIEGKPTLSADGMVAVCLVRRDVCEYFRTISVDDKVATVETKRVGQDPQRYSFSMADAQRAGVAGKQNWTRYPSRMLLARARAALARDVYPDLLLGLYDPDELEPAPPQRAQVDARPAPAPATGAQMVEGEFVPERPIVADVVERFRAEMERIGRSGTEEEARAIVAAVGKSGLTREERKPLAAARDKMLADIKARSPEHSDPEPPHDPHLGEVRS